MPNTTQIDQVLADVTSEVRVPGVVAAAADASGTIYEKAFGRRSLASQQPMTTDTVFRIASMTKAVTAAAAMQMVEQGRLSLDQPAGEILPVLAEPKVLDGFDSAGKPVLRPARGRITLRNLLTHTAGFVYDTWNEQMNRFARVTGLPAARTGKLEALSAPLGHDPDQCWEYGINIDMAGRMVEVVSGQDLETYMRTHLFEPLGMRDTSYVLRPEWSARLATVHTRAGNGSLEPIDVPAPPDNPEFFPGGGGLFSTARDYLIFLQALMHGGSLNGARILKPETVALMGQNHMGPLNVRPLKTSNPQMSNDVELFPGMDKKWGLSFLINTQDVPNRRSAGSLAWAGLNNTYYWLDPKKKVAGVLMTQILPFGDKTVLETLDRFEAAVYHSLS
ncbi:MAG TPA: serine hydrolase domain-containing protein [Acetobacteraceae bacterium]|nr:serine hydrolase domain-containing protein [Acetobacteraceae bacterium]